uniref:Transcription elongation regulator 1 (inferred by orthology to a human protein) n=1 Tax=Strongyloides venezuelensis TaxID=75913 RepID=A0A0K0FL28_STRVS
MRYSPKTLDIRDLKAPQNLHSSAPMTDVSFFNNNAPRPNIRQRGPPTYNAGARLLPTHAAAAYGNNSNPNIIQPPRMGNNNPGPSIMTNNINPIEIQEKQKEIFIKLVKERIEYKDGDELWVEISQLGGKPYYFHAFTKQSVWNKPEGENIVIIDQHEFKNIGEEAGRRFSEFTKKSPPAINGYSGGKINQSNNMIYGGTNNLSPMTSSNNTQLDPCIFWKEYFDKNTNRAYYYNVKTTETTWIKPPELVEKELEERRRQEEERKLELERKKTNRAVKTIPVKGTQWTVVWTGNGKVFFHNPSTRQSLWERPPELFHRDDVDQMINNESLTNNKLLNGELFNNENDDIKDNQDNLKDCLVVDQQTTEEPLAKKKKINNSNDNGIVVPAKLLDDPSVQKEIEAQKTREQLPFEERVRIFKEMMLEKNVSATSIWEKELAKIVNDERYLLLNKDERKAEYDKYVKERLEIERLERKKRHKEAVEQFESLLEEAKLTHKSLYPTFAAKYSKDERFKKIEKTREREEIFNNWVKNIANQEKEEKKKLKHDAKTSFIEMLKEHKSLTRNTKWSVFKKKIDNDSRYFNTYLTSDIREELFKDYIKTLSSYSQSDVEDEDARLDRLKEKSLSQKALEERKKTVEKEKNEMTKDMKHSAGNLARDNAKRLWKTILVEKIKKHDISWHDAKKILRDDERYEECDYLSRSEKEKYFDSHIKDLLSKRQKEIFSQFDQDKRFTYASSWNDVKKILITDEIYSNLYSSERKLEKDFREWKDETINKLLGDFKELLRETKIITYRSKRLAEENEQHLLDILSILEKDNRYLILNDIPMKREKIFMEYIEKLDKYGPPPPPTSSESESVKKKDFNNC